MFCYGLQILTCMGMILWNFVVQGDNFIGQVLTFTLLTASLYTTYLWPGMLCEDTPIRSH